MGSLALVLPSQCTSIRCPRHPVVAHVDIFAIARAVELYRADHGELPERLIDLIDDGEGRRYLKGYHEAPEDVFGRPYLYEVRPDGTYSIWTLGDDGEPGGRGEDADVDLESARRAREEQRARAKEAEQDP